MCQVVNDLHKMGQMGHALVEINDILLYLNKNGIFNINLIQHFNNNSAQIQNLINSTNKINHTHQLYHG